MYWKIEPSGCCVVEKGIDEIAIQVRYDFYLESTEKNYGKTIVDELKIKESSKSKEVLGESDFEKTGKKIQNPLHIHIIPLPIDVSNSLIENIGGQLLKIIKGYNVKGYFDNNELIFIPNILCKYHLKNSDSDKIADIKLHEIKNNLLWQQ